MALPPQEVDEAFLREVDEGVRRDQVATLWQRYGKIGIAVLVLVLGALGGGLYWRDHQAKLAGKTGEDFIQAMEKLDVGEGKQAQPMLADMAQNGPGAYPTLAEMMQAADAVAGNDNAKAIKLLDGIAADEKRPQALRDAALLKSARLGFDTQPPARTIARLKDLAVPGNPWFGVAGELVAVAELNAGQVDKAKILLTAIVRDPAQSASLRSRLGQLALSLGVDAKQLQPPSTGVAAAEPAK